MKLGLNKTKDRDAETLEHCLTVIQGVLDMDDFEQAHRYLKSYISCLLEQELLKVFKKINKELR